MIKKKVDKTCTQYWKKDWKYVSMAGTPNFGHLSASILILKNLAHDKIFLFKFLTISKCVLGLDSCSWMIYGCPQCTWRVTWALFHPNFLSDVGMEHHVTFSGSVSLLGNVVWFMACQGCYDSSLPRSNSLSPDRPGSDQQLPGGQMGMVAQRKQVLSPVPRSHFFLFLQSPFGSDFKKTAFSCDAPAFRMTSKRTRKQSVLMLRPG